MSEYQYYEFRAVDKPLTRQDQAALRAVSSRAEITATSLTNEYHFGDFKGDVPKLMAQYFDAHIYYSNWGTHTLMFRLPAKAFPLAAAGPYAGESFNATPAKASVVLDFRSDTEEPEDYTGENPDLGSMLSLRTDLMAGDYRCLYLAWLSGLDHPHREDFDEAEPEPPVPPGLGDLSPALIDFAAFLRVDDDLIAAAAAASEQRDDTPPTAADMAAWVAGLAEAEKTALLVRAVNGEGASLGAELQQRFRAAHAATHGGPPAGASPRRTVSELLAARDVKHQQRTRKEAEKKARTDEKKAREAAAARARHLDALAGKEDDVWRRAEAAIETRLPKQYDAAVQMLVDLRELAARDGSPSAVLRRVADLRQRHAGKKTLLERIDRAGFPPADGSGKIRKA